MVLELQLLLSNYTLQTWFGLQSYDNESVSNCKGMFQRSANPGTYYNCLLIWQGGRVRTGQQSSLHCILWTRAPIFAPPLTSIQHSLSNYIQTVHVQLYLIWVVLHYIIVIFWAHNSTKWKTHLLIHTIPQHLHSHLWHTSHWSLIH